MFICIYTYVYIIVLVHVCIQKEQYLYTSRSFILICILCYQIYCSVLILYFMSTVYTVYYITL